MAEPYEGREERDWQEDEDDNYEGLWAIFMSRDPNTMWERTPHNKKALEFGLPHKGDAIVGTTGNDLRRAKSLVFSKAMGGFSPRAGEFSKELLGDDTTLNFGGKSGNQVIGLSYRQVKVIVSTGKDKGVRLTTNERICNSTKFRQFKDLYDRSMEEMQFQG